MNKGPWIAGTIALCALLTASSRGADSMTRFNAAPGSGMKIRLEGTSTMHDWQAEGPIISGFLEVGPGFPMTPGQTVTLGKVEARAEAAIPVRSIKSIEKNGSPYSDKMDEVMWKHLKAPPNSRISFRLDELVLKELPKSNDAPYVFDATGQLAVAGVTNKVSFTVNVTPLSDQKLKVAGATTIKMSDFQVEAVNLLGIKTGDEVKLSFVWPLAQKKPAEANTSK